MPILPRLLVAATAASAVAVGATTALPTTDELPRPAVATEVAAATDLPTTAPSAASVETGDADEAATPTAERSARVRLPERGGRGAVVAAPPVDGEAADGDATDGVGADRVAAAAPGDWVDALGTSRDPVEQGGRTVRFSVEVEAATGLDPDAVAALVEEALYDERSWARDFELRRTSPDEASVRVLVGTPATVDGLCARAGLNTAGWLSCWNGSVAAINLVRWTDGVAHVEDLATYRRYVVNHEVGHGLGFGHVDCPGRGELAPVMQQQTKSLQGCLANEWRHP